MMRKQLTAAAANQGRPEKSSVSFSRKSLKGDISRRKGSQANFPSRPEDFGGIWQKEESKRGRLVSAAGRAIVERGKINHFSFLLCEMELKAELVRCGKVQPGNFPPMFQQGLSDSMDELVAKLRPPAGDSFKEDGHRSGDDTAGRSDGSPSRRRSSRPERGAGGGGAVSFEGVLP